MRDESDPYNKYGGPKWLFFLYKRLNQMKRVNDSCLFTRLFINIIYLFTRFIETWMKIIIVQFKFSKIVVVLFSARLISIKKSINH